MHRAPEALPSHHPGLVTRFTTQATLLGSDVLLTDSSGVLDALREHVAGAEGGGVAVAGDISSAFPAARELDNRTEAHPGVAVTSGVLGVATTGSVLLAEKSVEDRFLRILAREHIVLLPEAALVDDVTDAASTLRRLEA